MLKKILSFYKTSQPSEYKVPSEKAEGYYKRLRLQAFIAATLGYSLYYVCRTSLNVMKQPIIDAGVLNATQLGIVGACLYWTYAVGKFVNGFMAVDLVPRKATGAALGIVGLASYAAAGLMNIISGVLIDGMATPDPVTGELIYDFSYVSVFWLGAAIISFLLPILNWGRKKMEI